MKILISLSGGMDSTTLLGYLLENGHEVQAISFYYGSKHNIYENQAAVQVAKYYGVRFDHLDISGVMDQITSNLLSSGGDIPEGSYDDANMKKTVVPGRNSIFASILGGIAESRGMDFVALGVHSGDHAIYPDCRPEWVTAMAQTIMTMTDYKVKGLMAPFLMMDKGGILQLSLNFKTPVPYHLTRTCYKDQEVSCGVCGSCDERLAGFKKAGMVDPILYATRGAEND